MPKPSKVWEVFEFVCMWYGGIILLLTQIIIAAAISALFL